MKQLKISLSDGLRALLDAAAARSGGSLGEEIRGRLERTFADDAIDPATRDLAAAIARFARLIERDRSVAWHADMIPHKVLGEMIATWLQEHPPVRQLSRGPRRPMAGSAAAELGFAVNSDDPKTIAAALYRIDRFTEQEHAKFRETLQARKEGKS